MPALYPDSPPPVAILIFIDTTLIRPSSGEFDAVGEGDADGDGGQAGLRALTGPVEDAEGGEGTLCTIVFIQRIERRESFPDNRAGRALRRLTAE